MIKTLCFFKKYVFFSVFFLTIPVLFFNGCYIENKIGKDFINNAHNISLLILEPDIILKSNIKDTLSDSISNTDLLTNFNETVINKIYMEELKNQLASFHLNIFTSSKIDTFFTLPPPAYLFNIAQIEIEEFFYPFKEKLTTDSLIYTQEFLLNAFNLNTWFEFSELNSEKKPELLFSNFYIKDDINGDFKVNLFTNDVTYVYNRKNLTSEDIEILIRYAGKTNANYIFNHLLNKNIKEKMNNKADSKYFFYYEPNKKKILFLENYMEFRKVK